MKYTFDLESMHIVLTEGDALLKKHYKEIAHYQDIPLDPCWRSYGAMEGQGLVRAYTARDEKHNLIGYAVFFVKNNMHYKQSLQAVQDILFIDPEKRGFGASFLKWCDEQLKKEGVQVVYHHVKKNKNFGPMLERLGYEMIDLVFGKRLDKGE